jgi:hypothetical protein
MITRVGRALGLVGVLTALTLPGMAAQIPVPKPAPRPATQAPPAPIFAKVKYESALSLNDRCPVRGGKLSPNIRPTYINRQPVGFC